MANERVVDFTSLASVQAAVRSGTIPDCVHDVYQDGTLRSTPLHRAAGCPRASAEGSEYLISQGCNVHARDSWLRTPLHRAAAARISEVCRVLVAHGAMIDPR